MRDETRKERYLKKSKTAIDLPVTVATTNFCQDANIAYVMRALACFGGSEIHIIGKVPKDNELRRLSGGHSDLIGITKHRDAASFVGWCKTNNTDIICAELTETSANIHTFKFNLDSKVCFVVGNETDGVPTEIVLNAKTIHIPMIGRGVCLNTAITANILLYEYNKRYLENKSNEDLLVQTNKE